MAVINVFISHSWAHYEHYETLADWIFGEPHDFFGTPATFINCSVPKDDPIHDAPNDSALARAIYAKVAESDVVVIPTGMYANYSDWMDWEIQYAHDLDNPVLAVILRGQKRNSGFAMSNCTDHCGWTKEGVVTKIHILHHMHS